MASVKQKWLRNYYWHPGTASHSRKMSKLVIKSFSVSIDGFGAGPGQNIENPMGRGGMALHEWVFPTKTFQAMHGKSPGEGETGIDDNFAASGFENIGAWILGRNMFGPERGPWQDLSWKGWWGDNPPYHTPVYILTHHERADIEMAGGTTFHFIKGGIEAALQQAKKGAGGKDIRIGGGVATVRQYLKAGLVDEMHLAMAPILLGSGENLFLNLNLSELGYICSDYQPSDKAVHLVFRKA